jgi:1,4-alpha-glucan branching enzyme
MGEEFGADQPFPFFCDFEPELAELVREGRRNEFAKFPEFQDPESRKLIPDPTTEQTLLSAKLDWSCVGDGGHADTVRLYRDLLAVRKREIVPRLSGSRSGSYEILGQNAVSVAWRLGDGARLHLLANMASRPLVGSFAAARREFWSTGINSAVGPWAVRWSLET